MKKLITVFLLLISISSFAAKYYVAPDGDDTKRGTITEPFATWQKLGEVLAAGDTGYFSDFYPNV